MVEESLWASFDLYLKEYLLAQLGEDGEYSDDLVVKTVSSVVLRLVTDWAEWEKPAIAIMGQDIIRESDEFGDGDIHYAKKYPYNICIITEGTQESCVRDGKIIEARLEKAFRELRINLASDGDEAFDLVAASNSRITQYRKESTQKPKAQKSVTTKDWYALTAMRIVAESTV